MAKNKKIVIVIDFDENQSINAVKAIIGRSDDTIKTIDDLLICDIENISYMMVSVVNKHEAMDYYKQECIKDKSNV